MADRGTMGYVSGNAVQIAYIDQPNGVATGGTSSSITVGGLNYTLLAFTTSGTLTVTKSGLFDFLLFARGGGGGTS